MTIQDLLLKENNVVRGSFDDLKDFNFEGVYVLCDGDEVVYVGSAYARTIQVRLGQYLSKSDTGNTLGKTIAKKLSQSSTYDAKAKEKIDEAIKLIKTFSIYAFKHNDLEYRLIKSAGPRYNNRGKGED